MRGQAEPMCEACADASPEYVRARKDVSAAAVIYAMAEELGVEGDVHFRMLLDVAFAFETGAYDVHGNLRLVARAEAYVRSERAKGRAASVEELLREAMDVTVSTEPVVMMSAGGDA